VASTVTRIPRTILYVVQCFAQTFDGLVQEEPIECCTEDEAMSRALTLRPTKAGVLVWMRSDDADTRWDDDPSILFRAGQTGSVSVPERRRR
jgi:hypothetical protein